MAMGSPSWSTVGPRVKVPALPAKTNNPVTQATPTQAPYQPYNYNGQNSYDPVLIADVNAKRAREANIAQKQAVNQQTNAMNYLFGANSFNNTPGANFGTPLSVNERKGLELKKGSALAEKDYGIRTLNQQYGNDVARLGIRQGDLGAERELGARDLAGLDKIGGIYNAQLANQLTGLNQRSATDQRNLSSQSIARGSLQTEGYRSGRTDLANQLTNQTTDATLSNDLRQAQLDRQRDQQKLTNRKLESQAKLYGIDGNELRQKLEQGLERLNLSALITTEELANMIESSNIEDQMIAQRIVARSTDPVISSQFPKTRPLGTKPSGNRRLSKWQEY